MSTKRADAGQDTREAEAARASSPTEPKSPQAASSTDSKPAGKRRRPIRSRPAALVAALFVAAVAVGVGWWWYAYGAADGPDASTSPGSGAGRGDGAQSGSPGQAGGRQPKPMLVELEPVRRGEIAASLALSGEVVAADSIVIAAAKEGPVTYCPWREGDSVKAGEKLIEIDREVHRAEVEAAEAALRSARAKLADLEAGTRSEEVHKAEANVRRWQATLNEAHRNFQRQERLMAKNATSQQSLDQAHEGMEVAEAELASARETLAMLRAGPTPTELAVQSFAVDESAARLALAKAHLDECVITAPFDGMVTKVHIRAGDLATPRSPLMEMYAPASLVVRFSVPEAYAATVSFLALFVPFLLVPGLTSLLFRELILVIAGIVIVSLAVAVAMTPMLTTLFLARSGPGRQPTWFERGFDHFTEGYGWVLQYALRGRWLVALGFVAVLALAVWMIGWVGGEFLPMVDDGRIMVKLRLPTGASVEETDRILRMIEQRIVGDPRIDSAFALAGGRVQGIYTYEVANEGQIDIQLVPKSQRDISTGDFAAQLQPVVGKVPAPGGRIMARQMPTRGIRGLRAADVVVEVRGQDMNTLADLAQRTGDVMEGLGQFRNVSVSMDITKPEYQIKIDRTKAAELGVSVAEVAGTLHSLVGGAVVSRYRQAGEYYDIRLLVPEARLDSRRSVEDLVLSQGGGNAVRVRDVARVDEAVGPLEIIRKNQVRQVEVEASLAGGDLATAMAGLRAALNDLERPPGYDFDFSGQAELMADRFDGNSGKPASFRGGFVRLVR